MAQGGLIFLWQGAGGGGGGVAAGIRDVVGSGGWEERSRNWKALGEAEYDIHRLTKPTAIYLRELADAKRKASEAIRSDEPPEWMRQFVAERLDYRAHMAAMDVLLKQVDLAQRKMTEAWLKAMLLEQMEDDDALAVLLLNL